MSAADLIRDSEVNRGIAPVDNAYTSEWDVAVAAFKDQKAGMNYSSADTLKHDALLAGAKKYQYLTGEEVGLKTLGGNRSLEDVYQNDMDKVIIQNRLQGLKEWNDIPTSSETIKQAEQIAKDTSTEYDATVLHAKPGAHTTLATIAGSIPAWFADPVNFLTAGVTGGVSAELTMGKGIGHLLLVEGAVNSGSQAAVEPKIKEWQNEIGHDYSWQDSAINVAFAGAAGMGLTGLVHGISRASGFKGLTPEGLQGLYRLQKQEIDNERPVMGDAGTEIAHSHNMDSAMNDLRERKIPDPVKFYERASPKVFNEDAVTYEHAAVARDIVDRNIKKGDIDAAARPVFMAEMKREFLIDASLERGDLAELGKASIEAQKSLKKAKQDYVIEREKLRILSNEPIKHEFKLKRLAEQEIAFDKATKTNINAAKKYNVIKRRIDSTVMAQDADAVLKDLLDNKIPESLNDRFNVYKKNIKNAISDIKEYENKPVKVADEIINPTEESIAKEIKDSTDVKINAAIDNDFDRMVADSVTGGELKDAKIIIVDDEGNMVEGTLSEINDSLKAEEEYLSHLTACGIG